MKVGQSDWGPRSHSIAFSVEIPKQNLTFYMILNAYSEAIEFQLPPVDAGKTWCRWIDTASQSPHDIVEWQWARPIAGNSYLAGPRSVAVLIAGL